MQKAIEGIKQLQKIDRPYIIGIDGLSGAGKTTITEKMKEELMKEEYKLIVIHIDDLIVEQAKRYNTGHPEWYEYYTLQWDVQFIKENLLEAVHQNQNQINLNFYETEKDQCNLKRIELSQCTLILIEGIFLQRKEWSTFFDFMIYLDCHKEARYDRVLQRDTYIGDMNERISKYERRYWIAEDYYLEKENPLQTADILIKNHVC